jgi:hypothetical protein
MTLNYLDITNNLFIFIIDMSSSLDSSLVGAVEANIEPVICLYLHLHALLL